MAKVLHIDLRVGQTMTIGGAAVTLQEKSGRLARLRIEAGPGVEVEPPTKKTIPAKLGAMVGSNQKDLV